MAKKARPSGRCRGLSCTALLAALVFGGASWVALHGAAVRSDEATVMTAGSRTVGYEGNVRPPQQQQAAQMAQAAQQPELSSPTIVKHPSLTRASLIAIALEQNRTLLTLRREIEKKLAAAAAGTAGQQTAAATSVSAPGGAAAIASAVNAPTPRVASASPIVSTGNGAPANRYEAAGALVGNAGQPSLSASSSSSAGQPSLSASSSSSASSMLPSSQPPPDHPTSVLAAAASMIESARQTVAAATSASPETPFFIPPQQRHEPQASPSQPSSILLSGGSSRGNGGGGGSGGGSGGFSPVRLGPGDWLFYLRIQKTGSQTFWTTLQKEVTAETWRGRGECPERSFCGAAGKKGTCEDVIVKDAKDILRAGVGACKFLFRGHVNRFDYLGAMESVFVSPLSVKFVTLLREPLARALSEYRHVTEGLVAQFGPETFGAAWDYGFYWNKTAPLDEKRKAATLRAWLGCVPCRAGSSNRQARFLGGLTTTGEVENGGRGASALANKEAAAEAAASSSLPWSPPKGWVEESALLEAAVAGVRACTFVGIAERFEDSMLLLKRTFPHELRAFTAYQTSPHPVTEQQAAMATSATAMASIAGNKHAVAGSTDGGRGRVIADGGSKWDAASAPTEAMKVPKSPPPLVLPPRRSKKHRQQHRRETEGSRDGGGGDGGDGTTGERSLSRVEKEEFALAGMMARATAGARGLRSPQTPEQHDDGEERDSAGKEEGDLTKGEEEKSSGDSGVGPPAASDGGGEGEGDNGGSEAAVGGGDGGDAAEDLRRLVALNRVDLGVYAVAKRLFERKFAEASGVDPLAPMALGDRLGDRFQFAKDVTITRRKKKFTAQQFTLRPAVYLGATEGGDSADGKGS